MEIIEPLQCIVDFFGIDESTVDWRLHHGGSYGVDPHAVLGELHRQVLRE